MVWIWVVAGLTWVIVMMGIAQLSRFYSKFQEGRRELDANLLNMAGQFKKMQSTLTELLAEQRRITRLTLEQLDLKRSGNEPGDFEIVEEPIPPAPPSAGVTEPAVEPPPPMPDKRRRRNSRRSNSRMRNSFFLMISGQCRL